MMRGLLAIGAIAAACGGGHGKPDAGIDAPLEGFTAPDLVCPGGPGCESAGDGVLKVGAATQLVDTDLTAPEWNQDIRDPIIYDPSLTIARFVEAANPTQTILQLLQPQ
jgi:hypothetical protein